MVNETGCSPCWRSTQQLLAAGSRRLAILIPAVSQPGSLIQIDTIHIIPGRLYVYTILDVCSRWAKAIASKKINTHRSLCFTHQAQKDFPFDFSCLQSDHGPEFSSYFSEHVTSSLNTVHRHSRVRKPNDNGHLERFNWILKEECLQEKPRSYYSYQRAIKDYLNYYNNERLYLGIDFKIPAQVLRSH
jgi:transposase InsO family protein